LPCPSRLRGVDTGGELLAQGIALCSCGLQPDVRVNTHGNPSLDPGKAILPSPPLPAAWTDLQIQATTIEQPEGLVPRLGRADPGIRQRHVGATLVRGSLVAPVVAPALGAASLGWRRNTRDHVSQNHAVEQ